MSNQGDRMSKSVIQFEVSGAASTSVPNLPDRCGVCIGFEKDQDRYIVRLITGGVESDIALRHAAECKMYFG